MKKKVLSFFLALVMVLCIVPMAAFAEGASTEPTESSGELSLPEESVEEKTGAAAVQALIDALPDAESIDESNMEDVMNQLESIDDAKLLLSDEEENSIDYTRYDAAAAVLQALMLEAENGEGAIATISEGGEDSEGGEASDTGDVPGEEKTYEYTADENSKTCTITAYNGTDTAVVVPKTIDGYTVTGISTAFMETGITSITIPDTVTALDDYAFDQCTDLTSITLPSTLTSIGERAFYGCTSLESIVIPDSVTSLGSEVLGSCANLTNVKLSSGLSEIPEYAFMDCTSLTSIEIPENIKYIDMLAFYNCESLTDISLPSGLEYIGDNAFGGCSALSSITIPASAIYLGEQMFVDCTSLTSVQLPSGLSEIPYYMFNGCTSLKSIVIPDSVTAIMDCAFKGCTQLSNVTIPNGVTYIGEYAFSGCGNLTGITLPGELNQIAGRAFEDCGLTSITLPDKLQIINDLAFKNCKFDSITIPDSVTVLSKDFVDRDVEIIHNNNEAVNNWLAKYRSKTYDYEIDDDHCIIYNYYGKDAVVEIPSQIENVPVTIIDSGAFRDCFFVTDVTIPNTVTTIGEEAFVNCSGLVNITIPDSVTVISQYAFDSCTSLKTITIPDSVTSLRDNTFQNCTSLESIKLPSTIKKIPDGLFEDCTSLISVEIPASVTKIEEDAFRGCTSLKSITIPEGVTKIREDAFNECTSLETVTLPSTLTYIDEYAFDKCTSLKSITIPEGISGISIATFRDCTSLESVTLPSTLEEIEWAAFLGCKSLTYIEIPEGATTIESEAFAESGLEIAVLPESLTSIADDAFEKDVTVYGVAGSYAESWCKKNGITFIAGKPTVTGIKLSKTKLSLATDASETITATVKPEGITGVTITWSSSNENVATVSDNGTITAVGKCGTAVITASAMGVTAQCTVTITKNGQPAAHEYNATEYKWAADHSTCTATRTCKNCGAVETANGTVTAESTELSCTTDAATIYTATFAATWATTQKDTVTSQTATGHSWGETTYTWAQDYSSCTATRTCSTCSTAETATDSTLQKTVVPNSCEVSDGYEEYTADDFDTDDKDWTVKQTTKIDTAETKEHTWGETTYTWSADFKTCKARRSCILNKDYSYEELTATVTEEGTAPTCNTGGKVLFTAKFAEGQTWAVTQKKEVPLPPTGHTWGETTYTWAADYSTCTATRTCANGCGKTETETVSATGTTTTEPTCTTAGVTTYSADFTKTWAEDTTKEVEIAALGHNFAAPTITWDSTGTKATAALLCGVCGQTESRDCTITSQVYNATCTEDKKTVYTASITVNGTTYTSENTVTEEGTAGHIWGTTIYEWAEDGSSCTAKRVCSRNSEHVETAQGIVSKIETKPVSCGEPGYIECAAKFREDWAKNKTLTLPGETIEHSFGEYVPNKKATCTESGTLLATCGNCGATDEIEDPNAPALGHDYKETENKNGKITYTCSRCGASYTKSAPSTETGSKTSVTSAGSQSDSVRTGDSSNLILWLALLLVSSGAVTATTIAGRKRWRAK